MKIWVCRDVAGSYSLFVEGGEPEYDCEWEDWEDYDSLPLVDALCPALFKKFTGLKRHLKPGTKKLMDWTPPLRKQGEK